METFAFPKSICPVGIYLFKVNNQNIAVVLVSLLLIFNRVFQHFSGVSIVDFEQVNAGWITILSLPLY